jgi:hypothetical protein
MPVHLTIKYAAALAAILSAGLQGCYYDKYEHFQPKSACDSIPAISYDLHVKEIFQRNCTTCHGGNAASGGGIVLDTYNGAKQIAQTGKLLSSITWDGNAVFMPKGATQKIDECSIRKIRQWIEGGYPQ